MYNFRLFLLLNQYPVVAFDPSPLLCPQVN